MGAGAMTELPQGFVLDTAAPPSAVPPAAGAAPTAGAQPPLRFTVRPKGVPDPPALEQPEGEIPPGFSLDVPLPANNGGQFAPPPPDGGNFRTAREGPSPPVATPWQGALGGVAKGVTFNFFDELKGLAEAGGGLDPNNPEELATAMAILKGAYRKATGDPEADAAYRVGTSQEREKQALRQEQQPAASIGGEIAGGLATAPLTGGGVLARGAGLGARTLQAARAGAIQGALSGAGEGDGLADRAGHAATGGAIGGAIGGVASPLMELGARGVGAATREAGRYLFPSIEARSARIVDNARQSAERVDPGARTRLTPAELAATPEATIADTASEPGRAVARWAANASPEARETLNSMIDPRFVGQAPRIIGWLNNTFHYPNATAQQAAIEQTARTVNRAAYARAYRDGSNGLWSPELERLSGSDAVASAMRRAASNAKDEAVVGGYGAMNPRITFNQSGVMQFNRGPNGVPTYPDLQYWDLVRRELSDAARAATPGSAEARRLNNFAATMNTELDRLVPSYQQARQGAAQAFGAENALEAGANFITSRMANPEARRALAQMSPAERQLFQDGAVSRYIQMLSEIGDRRDVLNSIANSPAARERLNIAFGTQHRAAEFEAMIRTEQVMNSLRQQVQGNSTTVRQLVEMGAVGTYGGVGAYMQGIGDPQTLATTLIAGAFVGRGRNVDQRVAMRVAEMLVSHDPAILQRGLSIVSRNTRFMDGIRALDNGIGRIGGQQGAHAPVPGAVQAGAVGRAEDNQENVPRPPGQ